MPGVHAFVTTVSAIGCRARGVILGSGYAVPGRANCRLTCAFDIGKPLRNTLGRMDCDDVDGVTSPRWPEWMAAVVIDDFDDDRRVASPNPRDVVQAVTDGAEVALAGPEMPACEFAAGSTPRSTSVWRWRAASCIASCIRGARVTIGASSRCATGSGIKSRWRGTDVSVAGLRAACRLRTARHL